MQRLDRVDVANQVRRYYGSSEGIMKKQIHRTTEHPDSDYCEIRPDEAKRPRDW